MTVFAAALLIWIRIFLPGLAWAWAIPGPRERCGERFAGRLFAGVSALIPGVLIAALTPLLLGQLGCYTPGMEWIALGVIAVAGLLLRSVASAAGRPLGAALPLAAVLLPVLVLALHLPRRGEWMVGGWDPGVYAGQAAALARHGTFYPPDPFFYEALTPTEREAFTRSGHGRTERFPAVLVHPESKGFSFEFFRLTPALFAAFYRAGGLTALTRANLLIALLSLPCFLALALKCFGRSTAGFAVLLLVVQPIWLYHTHWPLTEHLQLFLILGLLLTASQEDHRFQPLAVGALLFAAVLNRHSFLPFAALFLACLSLRFVFSENRRNALLVLAAGSAAGLLAAWINHRIAPASLRGWLDIRLIHGVAAVFLGGAWGMFGLSATARLRERLSRQRPLLADLAAGLLLVLLLLSWIFRAQIGTGLDLTNLQRLLPFAGRLLSLCAAAGLLAILFVRPRLKPEVFFPVILFLLAFAWMMILRKSIMDWFPWATRRYLTGWVPLVALAGGRLLGLLWDAPGRRGWRRAAAFLLLAALLGEILPVSRRAWRYTSYDGLAEHLAAAAAAAEPYDAIVADHPFWGTPLALLYGSTVLNGREIWMDESGRRGELLRATLARLDGEGLRVLLLTTTEEGPALFGPAIAERSSPVWASPSFSYEEIVQHPRADHYALRTRTVSLQLHRVR